MTLAMIARADQGGLGAQTWEFARHVRPDKTLVVLVGHQTRGEADVGRYIDLGLEVQTCYLPSTEQEAWLLDGIDHLWTAETWYSPTLVHKARARGVVTTVHANPEMGVPEADRTWLATDWLSHHFPDAVVTPFPVAGDVLQGSPVPMARTFVHVLSEAMEDRNGTEIVLRAAELLTHPCRLLMMGKIPRNLHPIARVGQVEITWLGHHPGLYYQAWPRADVLLMPRRFGGLCLPIQEAFAQQIPVLTLDLEPQRRWVSESWRVPARRPRDVRMPGGLIQVFDCDPADYAAHWAWLIESEATVRVGSHDAATMGLQLDWVTMLGTYDRLFDRHPVPA